MVQEGPKEEVGDIQREVELGRGIEIQPAKAPRNSKIYTKLYSMPNGEQVQEGTESADESGDSQSPDDDEEDSDDSDDSEEVDSPPRSEH